MEKTWKQLAKYWFKRRAHLRMYIFLIYFIFFTIFTPIYWTILPSVKTISVEVNTTITFFLGTLLLGIFYELLRHSQSQTNSELENLEIKCVNVDANKENFDDSEFNLVSDYYSSVNLKPAKNWEIPNEEAVTNDDFVSYVSVNYRGTGDLIKVTVENKSQFLMVIKNEAVGVRVLFPSRKLAWFSKGESITKIIFQRKGARAVINYGI